MYSDASLFIHDNRAWIEFCEENGWTAPFDIIDYGEGYDGMARHVSEMSGLERIEFEDCDLDAGKVVAPHRNHTSYPHWLCPEYIASKINCDLQEATNLLDCWVILDATKEMIETFISWVKVKGVDKALAYFEKLAMALAEVENIDPEDVTETEEPQYEAPDLYKYHVIGSYPDDDSVPWIKRQPPCYQKLIAKLQKCTDLYELAALGKETYQLTLNRDHAGVFWTEYNRAKARLESKIKLGPASKSFIQRITKANGNLGSLGAYLYKVQQGKVNLSNPPEDLEWTLIWKAYQERNEVHAHV